MTYKLLHLCTTVATLQAIDEWLVGPRGAQTWLQTSDDGCEKTRSHRCNRGERSMPRREVAGELEFTRAGARVLVEKGPRSSQTFRRNATTRKRNFSSSEAAPAREPKLRASYAYPPACSFLFSSSADFSSRNRFPPCCPDVERICRPIDTRHLSPSLPGRSRPDRTVGAIFHDRRRHSVRCKPINTRWNSTSIPGFDSS